MLKNVVVEKGFDSEDDFKKLLDGQIVAIEGRIVYSQITRPLAGKDLAAENELMSAKGWPVVQNSHRQNLPYYFITISDAKIVPYVADDAQFEIAKEYITEKCCYRLGGENNCSIKSYVPVDNPQPLEIYDNTSKPVKKIKLQDEPPCGTRVTLDLRVASPKDTEDIKQTIVVLHRVFLHDPLPNNDNAY